MRTRIQQVINYSGLNNSKFAEKLSLGQGTVSNYILGRRPLSLTYLEKILEEFPEISAEWLMRGSGDMFVSNNNHIEVNQNNNEGINVCGNSNTVNDSSSIELCKKDTEIELLKGKLQIKEERIEQLVEMIEFYKNK